MSTSPTLNREQDSIETQDTALASRIGGSGPTRRGPGPKVTRIGHPPIEDGHDARQDGAFTHGQHKSAGHSSASGSGKPRPWPGSRPTKPPGCQPAPD